MSRASNNLHFALALACNLAANQLGTSKNDANKQQKCWQLKFINIDFNELLCNHNFLIVIKVIRDKAWLEGGNLKLKVLMDSNCISISRRMEFIFNSLRHLEIPKKFLWLMRSQSFFSFGIYKLISDDKKLHWTRTLTTQPLTSTNTESSSFSSNIQFRFNKEIGRNVLTLQFHVIKSDCFFHYK